MTDATIELLVECEAHGIRLALAKDGGVTIDAPRHALTSDLVDRLKARKAELLAMLQPESEAALDELADAQTVGKAALARLNVAPSFPSRVVEALREACARWIDDAPNSTSATEPDSEPLGPDGWPESWIEPNSIAPCPNCGTFELWESMAGDLFGKTPGRWRCMKCDPPTAARRLAEASERIRQQMNRNSSTRLSG